MDENPVVRIRLDLAYDGTAFAGWAKQPGQRTVQGELEKALALLLRIETVTLTVGGRTDAGVHARGQVCHFDIPESLLPKLVGTKELAQTTFPIRRIMGALRKLGAADISVHRAVKASPNFDARFSGISRRYEYRLLPAGAKRDPLTRNFTAHLREQLDINLMNQLAQGLLGLRDFATFCKPRQGATTIRELQVFEWRMAPDGVFVARVKADAFCHSMVRSLVGLAVAVGAGRMTVEQGLTLAEVGRRSSAIRVMPPQGLSLEEIEYPSDEALAARSLITRAKRC